jgi:multiple sugar transport system permease protein
MASSMQQANRSLRAPFRERLEDLWKEIKRNRTKYVMVAPFMISFFLFVFLPVVSSIILSFTDFNMLQTPNFVGYRNYVKLLLNDEVFAIAIRNTLLIAFITGPLSYLMCFMLAWLINELSRPLRVFLTVVFYAPSISGNAYLIWKLIFSSDLYGYANSKLIDWGFIQEPILWLQDPKYIIWIVILVQLWLSLGVSFLAFIAGLQNVDRTLYEAGAIDGIKNRWQELWYITLPSMRPQLLFGAVMQITSSFSVGEVSMQLAGFPSVSYAGRTVLTHMIDYGTVRFEMGYASATATLLFLAMIFTNLVVQQLIRKVGQ